MNLSVLRTTQHTSARLVSEFIIHPSSFILICALLLVGHTLQAQVTNWDGSASTDWFDPLNWSAGVPDPADRATIPGGMPNQPTIGAAGAVAQSVLVSSGGFLTIAAAGSLAVSGSTTWGVDMSGTVENNGAFSINNITAAGILMRTGSLFTNKGSLQIGNTGDIGLAGINNSAGTFVNESGSITVDRTGTTPATVAGILNNASFTNQAVITIGGIANNLSYGLWNNGAAANFMNQAGGSITIDRIALDGLLNQFSSSFTNQGSITIGAVGSIGTDGIKNLASFNNSTCTALIRVASNNIIRNTGTFSNAGFIIENASGNSSITTNTGVIQNLNGGTFTTGGTPAITATGDIWTGCTSTDWATAGNWYDGTVPTASDDVIIPDVTNDPEISTAAVAKSVTVQSGAVLTIAAAGTLTIDGSAVQGILNQGTVENNGTITIGATTNTGLYGIHNQATFNNNMGGEINIDRSANSGITIGLWNETGTFTNAAAITIGAIDNTSPGVRGLHNQATFNNNSGGEIKIDRSSSSALRNQSGTFTNAAKITIGATDAAGSFGLYNQATFNNNSGGEIKIDRTSVYAMQNFSGTFTNEAKIVIGATAGVGSYGISNFASFQNSTCTALIDIVANAIIENTGTFTNAGGIIENASGNSSITTNTGVIQNLNGGTFTTGGNAPISAAAGDIWTGCTSTDWATATNWFDGTVPTASDDVTIPDVTNDPEISTAALAKSVAVAASATLTVTTNGELTINDWTDKALSNLGTVNNNGTIVVGSTSSGTGNFGIYNEATFNNNSDGLLTLDRGWVTNLHNLSGTFNNDGTITIGGIIGARFGIWNSATFNNLASGQINIDRVTSFGGPQGLFNNGTFDNAGGLTIGGNGGGGENGLQNFSTFNNNAGGEIKIDRTSTAGLGNYTGTFTNASSIIIGANAGVGPFGVWNQATFNNNSGGEIHIDRPGNSGINNESGFTNSATIIIGAISGGYSGLFNTAGNFNNSTCDALLHIASNSRIFLNSGTISNAGRIIENASINSAISTNSGIVQNLGGGTFTITTNTGLLTTFAGTLSACCPAANILYVNDDATGNNDGTSWTDAFTDLQSALYSLCPGITQIWVAEGTYKPTSGTDRSISFVMKNGVAIYGGFPNSGDPGFGDRDPDPATNGTVLSGDIGGAGNGDNSYHVIFNNFTSGSPLNGTAVLDGFTITGGNANVNSDLNNSGGGMCNVYASPTVTNCSFANNSASYRGGGMFNVLSTPAVSYCSFSGNSAGSEGGGMLCYATPVGLSVTHCTFSNNTAGNNGGGLNIREGRTTAPSVTHCTFTGNSVTNNTDSRGGGMYNDSTNTVIEHCTFSGNSASGGGGGLVGFYDFAGARYCSFWGNSAVSNGGGAYGFDFGFTSFSNCVFVGNTAATGGGLYTAGPTTNCSFSGNSATNGGAIHVRGNFSSIKNCILWGNSSEVLAQFGTANVTYSIVQGGYAGTGNLNTDPLFVDQPTIGLGTVGDLHLQSCSPAKNTGTATGAPADDFDGDSRPQGIGIDMGYDESTSPECCPAGNILYVNDDATGANSGLSWTDAFTDLQSALNSTCPDITQIWVATGTYKPTSGTNRSISFVMKNGVEILGGFPNTGDPGLDDRDWAAHLTILSGEIGSPGMADNSNNIIANNDVNSTAVLDGFQISFGSGLSGGDTFGGGLFNFFNASPTVRNCTFSSNHATYGGGVYNFQNCFPTFTNCAFIGNQSSILGVACHSFGNSVATFINCSFSGNTGGNGVIFGDSPSVLKNCIIWGNGTQAIAGLATITHSIIQGGHAGAGNLDTDPLFVSQPPVGLGTAGDLHLQICSPAIDAGTDAGAPADDLDGNARPFDAAPNVAADYDMGAYEYQQLLPAPTVSCQNITVQLDVNGSVTVPAADVSDNSTGCGTLVFLINGETSLAFTCDDLGNHTVTLTVTDAFDNTVDCEATITVADDDNPCCAAPVAACQAYTAVLGPGGTATVAPANVDDGSTAECGLQSITVSPNQFDCSDLGPQTVTLTVTDINGDSDQCVATVTVVDNTLPAITCPGPVTVTCSANVPAVNLAAVTASDNCGAPTKSHDGDATSNQTCTNRKTITRTYRATDGSGNSITCAQVITVYDNVQPNFTSVPANVTVQCNSVPAVGNPTATDGCGGSVTIAYNGQISAPGACPDASTITRQWTATDACGNTKTATQRITVIDSQKPNFVSVPANITVQCSAIPTPATPTATDNCDAVVAITYNGQTTTAGTCANAYTLTRRWTAEDNCGNTRTISQRITVVDNGKPVFTAFPPNTTIACDENPPAVGAPTASDGCGTATVTYLGQTTTSGNCPGSYQIKRTWRATDACGNTTAATQTIQVSDNGAPVFVTVPGPITIECNQPLPPLVNPTASDACGGYVHITFLGNVPTGSGCDNSYTITRTWRAQDLCGNTATTTQVITVQGNNFGQEGAENRAEGTQLKTQNSKLVTVNPNPTTDRIWLDLTDFAGEPVTVSIFSDLGRLVWENRIPAVEELRLQISLREAGAAAGMYTVSVRSRSGVVATRVVLVE